MEKDFWLERWEKEEIGFHQNETNPHLRQYWKELHPVHGSKVFVPLCGKSLDLLWLREQGHSVQGVELSTIATQAFFKENNFTTNPVSLEKFKRYEANDICILCGDFFDLKKEELADSNLVYDRASMVALPPEMRQRYVNHLVELIPADSQILLVTFDYNQEEMSGPPFAVSTDEVETLYSEYASVRLLTRLNILAEYPRFQERGLSRLQENIFLITLKKSR